MHRQPAKRSSLFLLELIIAILFFCLSSAVCVRIFVASHIKVQDSTNLNCSINQASSVAEIMRSDTDLKTCLTGQFPLGTLSQETDTDSDSFTYYIYYDDSWMDCEADDATYVLCLDCQTQDSMRTGSIRTYEKESPDDTIYTIEVSTYMQKEASWE